MFRFTQRFSLLLLAFLLLCWVILPPSARAHQVISVGDYVIEYRWLEEPPLVGYANSVFIGVRNIPASKSELGKLTLITPLDGTVTTGDLVPVSVNIQPTAGITQTLHWHIYVDDQMMLMPSFEQPTVVLQGIPNGQHTLKTILSDFSHREVGQMVVARFTVEGSSNQPDDLNPQINVPHESSTASALPPETYSAIDIGQLQVALITEGQSQILPLQPVAADGPGRYVAPFTPAQSGEHKLKVSGTLAGVAVDTEVTLERARTPTIGQRATKFFASPPARILGIALLGIVVAWIGIRLGQRTKATP